jgi:hypothetical protein
MDQLQPLRLRTLDRLQALKPAILVNRPGIA